jgi:hypothetical protein
MPNCSIQNEIKVSFMRALKFENLEKIITRQLTFKAIGNSSTRANQL